MMYRPYLLLVLVAIAPPVEAQEPAYRPWVTMKVKPPLTRLAPQPAYIPRPIKPPSLLGDVRDRRIHELGEELTVRCQLHGALDASYAADSLVAIARVSAEYDRLLAEKAGDPSVTISVSDTRSATQLDPACARIVALARMKTKVTEQPASPWIRVAINNAAIAPTENPVIEQFFPWPPRPPYGHKQVDPALFADHAQFPTLGAVDDFLRRKLDAAGYDELGYFKVLETGFAIVTKVERISWSGVFDSVRRFDASLKPTAPFNLADYIYRLFHAGSGRYRVFVFILTDKSWSPQVGQPVDFEQAQTWNVAGVNALPADLRKRNFDDNYRLTVLLYEFDYKEGDKAPRVSKESNGIRAHLAATKIDLERHP